MKKRELPLGWINKKRYLALRIGSLAILLGGFAILFGYNFLIKELELFSFILWLLAVIIGNSLFKSTLINKEKMETNKPMFELIRNIEGNLALEEVNKLLSRDDLSLAMRQKYNIEKVYTLLYLGRNEEAKELLSQIERPIGGNDLFIYLELEFELSDNPRKLLEIEFDNLNNIHDFQTKSTMEGVLTYRESILDAEDSGKPSEELREMINTQRDIFTMLMNQYRIIRIYRGRSRYLTREACEKIIEYANDLERFTKLANEVLEELGPVSEEERLEAERIQEQGAAFYEIDDKNETSENKDVVEAEVQEIKEDNNQ